jgi:hypothetical protein
MLNDTKLIKFPIKTTVEYINSYPGMWNSVILDGVTQYVYAFMLLEETGNLLPFLPFVI